MDVNQTTSVDVGELLRADLAAFADPGTELKLAAGDGDWIVAKWQEDGRQRSARFDVGAKFDLRDVLVRSGPEGSAVSYATFLASERMGDLKGLARNTLNVLSPMEAFVTPRAVSDGETEPASAEILVDEFASDVEDETAVVFVRAEAGAGKTTLLSHLVRAKAEGYLRGEEEALWLYVNAQGSRLARLDQALAATLDDLRASFPYHATTALVRAGALVLVIDGFDELIGTQGTYDEAFSSLASFIEGLRGGGSIVAAARSAYYEQEFAARADSTIGFRTDRWALRPVSLYDWDSSERRQFLTRLATERGIDAASAEGLVARVEDVFRDPNLSDIAGKPLFVTRVATLIADGVELAAGDDLVHRLIMTYLRREAADKLLSTRGTPLLSVEQLAEFYTEIAEEMWRQETRELSRTSLRELVQIIADLNELDDDARMTVVERTPYSAVMRTGGAPGSVAFEHELYFSYFLAQPIVEALKSSEAGTIARSLRKGRLPEQAGGLAGRAFLAEEAQTIIDAVGRASTVMSQGSEQIRENAGLIVAGLIGGRTVQDLRITGIDFIDCGLVGMEAMTCAMEKVNFRGVDLRDTRFLNSTATDVVMDTVLVDSATRLELRGLPLENIVGLAVADGERPKVGLYAPDELQTALAPLGLPAAETPPDVRHIDPETVEVVRLLSRIYERTNLATPDDEHIMRRVVHDREIWQVVHGSLTDSGVIREETRGASGQKVFMRMLVRPRDLLAGQAPHANVDSRIREFWDLLEERAPPIS